MIMESGKTANVWKALIEKSRSKSTGTFLLATQENRAGKIVIQDGTLVGITYGKKTNMDALEILTQLDEIRYSFNDNLLFPIRSKLNDRDIGIVMELLGFEQYKSQTNPPSSPNIISKKKTQGKQHYRSQTIPEEIRLVDPVKNENSSLLKVYRGQVID